MRRRSNKGLSLWTTSAWLGAALLSVGAVAFGLSGAHAQERPAQADPPAEAAPSEGADDEQRQPPTQPVRIDTECAAPRFRTQLMTPMGDHAPRDGALVAGLFPGGTARELPTIRLTRGRRSTNLVRTAIAPGLFRLTPDARRIYGRWTVEGVDGSPQVLFGRPGLPAAPARPDLERVERYRVASGGQSRQEVRAHFAFPIPNGVIAVISYFGEDDTPDLFARAIPTRDEAVLWVSSGRCSQLPEGASEPPPAASIRVAFVDRFGQVSRPSATQTLAR